MERYLNLVNVTFTMATKSGSRKGQFAPAPSGVGSAPGGGSRKIEYAPAPSKIADAPRGGSRRLREIRWSSPKGAGGVDIFDPRTGQSLAPSRRILPENFESKSDQARRILASSPTLAEARTRLYSKRGKIFAPIIPIPGRADILQERYIESLKEGSGAKLEVQPYGGIKLPYGQKDVKWFEPAFGTITSDTASGFKEMSLINVMRERERDYPSLSIPPKVLIERKAESISNEIKLELLPSYQSRVDSGELSVEQAKKQYSTEASNKFDEMFEDATSTSSFEDKLKRSEKFRKNYQASFDPIYKKEQRKKKLEFAADTVAIIASSVVPAVGISYFGAKGLRQATEGAKEDIRIAEISPSGDLFLPTYPGLIPSEKSQEAGTSFLFAGLSGIGKIGATAKELDVLGRGRLISKEWSVTSKELFKVGDETYLKISGSKMTSPYAKAEAEAVFPVVVGKGGKAKIIGDAVAKDLSFAEILAGTPSNIKTLGEGEFKILAGRGQVRLKYLPFLDRGVAKPREGWLKSTIDFGMAGRGKVSEAFIRSGDFKATSEASKIFSTSGEGVVVPDTIQ